MATTLASVAVEKRERPTAATPRALTTRYLDFWLLGGASLCLWAAMYLLQGFRSQSWAIAHHFNNLAAISATLALVVNYPHFMASYMLAYGQGGRFVLRYWYQLIAVPLTLIALMTLGFFLYGDAIHGRQILTAAHGFVGALGLSIIGQQPTGKELMGLLVNLMYFTVGWHYSKQVYGCMMVSASYDGYDLTPQQRTILRWSLYSIWAASYTHANLGGELRDFQGIPYLGLGLPAATYVLAMVVFAAGFIASLVLVVLRNFERNRRRPSANFLVPYVAFAAWWLPPLVQTDFFLLLVPLFHSLQYLPFVYKVERARLAEESPGTARHRGTLIVLGLVAAGFLAFELIPNTADATLGTFPLMHAWFFFVCAHLFINIHHYFIDNVLWRFRDPLVRQYLLA